MDSQHLTAGSLFVSHLCPPTLIDFSKISEPPRFSVQQLLEYQYDDEGWNWLIVNGNENTEVLLNNAIKKWPSSPVVYHRRALFDIYRNNFSNAFQIYKDGLESTHTYDLYVWFLSFLYHKASIHEYILYVVKAAQSVGLDYRSGPLWRELATLFIKIYNTALLTSGVSYGLVPDLFFSETTVTASPLIPSQTEQSVFKGLAPIELSGDGEQKSYISLFGDVNNLRTFFHKWFDTPTLNLAKVWEAFCAFERAVAGPAADHAVISRMISSFEPNYSRSSTSYDRLVKYYSKIPYNDSSDNLQLWLEVIDFEKSNPIGLDVSLCNERVIYTYYYALNYLPTSSQLWYDLFQYNLSVDRSEPALKILRTALEKYLPNHPHLSLCLVIYSEKFSNEIEDSTITSEKLDGYFSGSANISSLFGITSDSVSSLQYGRASEVPSLHVIQLLNFIRRRKGGEAWRLISENLMGGSGVVSWDLAWYLATVEINCFNDLARGLNILSLAQDLLPFDLKNTLQHFYLLVSYGKLDPARTLIVKCLTSDSNDITRGDNTKLWLAWLNMELFYGTKGTLEFAENLFLKQKQQSGKSQLLAGISWNHFCECVEWSSAPLKLFSGLTDAGDSELNKSDFSNIPVVVRPDISSMSVLDIKATAAMEAKSLLHSSKRPPMPPSLSTLDSIVTPPKPIFDLLCLLPTPEGINSAYRGKRGYSNPSSATDLSYLTSLEFIDYLLSMIVSTDFNVACGDYKPLPVDYLTKLRDVGSSVVSSSEGVKDTDVSDPALGAIRKIKSGGGISVLLDLLQKS